MNDLLDELMPSVARICGSIALDDGPDAVQETLIVVLRRLRSLRDPAALGGWVRVIATREALRVARRRHPAGPTAELEDPPAPGDPQLASDIRAVLERLPPKARAVLVLRDLEGLDESAVAAVLDVPGGTVKSRLSRARERFRQEWTA